MDEVKKVYDYSALSKPVSKVEIAARKRRQKQQEKRQKFYVLKLLGLVFCVLYTAAYVWAEFGLVGLVVVGIGSIVMVSVLHFTIGDSNIVEDVRLEAFAQTNGMVYTKNPDRDQYSGSLFESPSGLDVTQQMTLPGGLSILNYLYDETYNSTTTTMVAGAFVGELRGTVPHIVLNGKRNPLTPKYLESNTKMSLEGNFDSIFTTYALDGASAEVLRILTPDVMHVFTERFKKYDIEFIGSRVYFHRLGDFNLTQSATYEKAAVAVYAAVAQINKQVSTSATVSPVGTSL